MTTHTLLTRVLDSLKHLHTLHGPCTPSGDGKICPHAAVIRELEDLLYTPTLNLEQSSWEMIKEAARRSSWMPPEHMMNDWVSDVVGFLTGPQDEFQAVAPFSCEPAPPLSHNRPERDTARAEAKEANERVSWLETQREVECQQKEAALAESAECLTERDSLRAEVARLTKKVATLSYERTVLMGEIAELQRQLQPLKIKPPKNLS